jgi:hypothetical protein
MLTIYVIPVDILIHLEALRGSAEDAKCACSEPKFAALAEGRTPIDARATEHSSVRIRSMLHFVSSLTRLIDGALSVLCHQSRAL